MEDAGLAARDAGDERGALGEEIDVAGEGAGLVGGDDVVVVVGVLDVDGARFDDVEVDDGLAGAEDVGVVGEVEGGADGTEGVDFFGVEDGKGDVEEGVWGHVAPLGWRW